MSNQVTKSDFEDVALSINDSTINNKKDGLSEHDDGPDIFDVL